MELRKELSRATTLDLPATLVFDYPSTDELAASLVTMLPVPEQARPPVAESGRGKARGNESMARVADVKCAEPPRQIKAWRPPQRDDITAQVTCAGCCLKGPATMLL